jgi:hypothetical protein
MNASLVSSRPLFRPPQLLRGSGAASEPYPALKNGQSTKRAANENEELL